MKKDGSICICVDFRKLNILTKFDTYPMPRIDDLLDAVGRAKYLTTLDLAKGYWQVPMHEEDKAKTAFSSPIGLLQFTIMPFGLSRAPATFQRLMDKVLQGTERFTGVYLDDVVIRSNEWDEHLQHIEEVLEQAELTIKMSKCKFAFNCCSYLGHQI